MAKIVTVEIDQETAEFSVDLTGFQGEGCGDITKMFQDLGTAKVFKKKPEWKLKQTNVCNK